jgi:hypothetical protein
MNPGSSAAGAEKQAWAGRIHSEWRAKRTLPTYIDGCISEMNRELDHKSRVQKD